MNTDDYARSFLEQLYAMTGGDTANHVSMYEVGSNIGIERAEARNLGEDLMIQGLVELKTLAGGIAITPDGLKFLGRSATTGGGSEEHPKLSNAAILTQEDLTLLMDLLSLVRGTISKKRIQYEILEELVFDLKTIEVQMLSPKPKSSVIKPLLYSIEQTFRSENDDTAAKAIAAAISEQ